MNEKSAGKRLELKARVRAREYEKDEQFLVSATEERD